MTVGCWLDDDVRTAADGMAGANAAADPARSVMMAAESFMVASECSKRIAYVVSNEDEVEGAWRGLPNLARWTSRTKKSKKLTYLTTIRPLRLHF